MVYYNLFLFVNLGEAECRRRSHRALRVEVFDVEVADLPLVVLRSESLRHRGHLEVVRMAADAQVLSPVEIEPASLDVCLLLGDHAVSTQIVRPNQDHVRPIVAVIDHFPLGLSEQILDVLRLHLLLVDLVFGRHRLLGGDVVERLVREHHVVGQLAELVDLDVDVLDVHLAVGVLRGYAALRRVSCAAVRFWLLRKDLLWLVDGHYTTCFLWNFVDRLGLELSVVLGTAVDRHVLLEHVDLRSKAVVL